jgi:hypothetical protein
MDMLAAYGSDSEDDNSSASNSATRIVSRPCKDSSSSVANAIAAKEDALTEEIGKRESRLDTIFISAADQLQELAQSHGLLPAQGTQRSMVHWDKDYLSAKQALFLASKSENPKKVQELRESASFKVDGGCAFGDWSEQLRSQTDFHNPHFFQAVVDLFHIQNTMGTNVNASPILEDWESSVMELEERARIRQQHEQNASSAASAFGQTQLKIALEQQDPRR